MKMRIANNLARVCLTILLPWLASSSLNTVAQVFAEGPSVYGVKSVTTIMEPGGRVSWSHSGNNLIAFDKGEQERDEKSGVYYDIYTMNPDGTNEICLTCGGSKKWSHKPQKHMWQPAWHPSGDYIAFQAEMENHPGPSSWSGPPNGLYNNLWVMTSDGESYLQLTDLPAVGPDGSTGILHPVFSHDGTMLLWSERLGPGDRWGEHLLRLADFNVSVVDGQLQGGLENIRTYQLEAPAFHESHDFSPDDDRIIFAANLEQDQDATEMDIYTLDITTEALTNLTRHETDDWWDELPTYSPDGSKILYISSSGYEFDPDNWLDTLRTDYWLMDPPDGSNKQRLTFFNEPGYPEHTGKRTIASDNSWGPDGMGFVALLFEDDGEQDSTRIVVVELEGVVPAVNVVLSTDKANYVSDVDTTAVLTAVVTDENDDAISGLVSSAFATTLALDGDSVAVTVTFTETATAGTYTGNLDISSADDVEYVVEVSVTDNGDISGSGTATFNVVSESVNVALSTDKSEYVSDPDAPAVLTAVVTDEKGDAISGLVSFAFATTLDRASVDVTFTETATAGTYTGNLDISSAAADQEHVVELSVTDTRAISGSGTASFTIGPENLTLSVTAITDKPSYVNRENVLITITVTDGASPVEGAAVHLKIDTANGKIRTDDGTTGSDGTARFQYKVNLKRDGGGICTVNATAAKDGLESGSGSTAFEVTE